MSMTPATVSGGARSHAEAFKSAGAALWRRLANTVGAVIAERLVRLAEQRAVDALSALPDRQLKDIGLTRFDIPHAVRHGLQEPVFRQAQ